LSIDRRWWRLRYSRSTLAGVALLALGAILLIDELIGASMFGTLFLLLMGLGLTAVGVTGRLPGLTIPGGILAGIGLGSSVLQLVSESGAARGGTFLVCFALGWVSIVPASRAAGEAHTWAYVPALVLGVVGVALLVSAAAPGFFEVVGRWWPLALIVVGVLALMPRKDG